MGIYSDEFPSSPHEKIARNGCFRENRPLGPQKVNNYHKLSQIQKSELKELKLTIHEYIESKSCSTI